MNIISTSLLRSSSTWPTFGSFIISIIVCQEFFVVAEFFVVDGVILVGVGVVVFVFVVCCIVNEIEIVVNEYIADMQSRCQFGLFELIATAIGTTAKFCGFR